MFDTPMILLVSSDIAAVKARSLTLQKAGYRVSSVPNAVAATKAVKACGPVLLIIDQELPLPLNGSELCKALRQEGFDLPVILMVEAGDEKGTLLALRSGAKECVRKTAGHLDYLPECAMRLILQARNEKEARRVRQELDAQRLSDKLLRRTALALVNGQELDALLAETAQQLIAQHGIHWVTVWLAKEPPDAHPKGTLSVREQLTTARNWRVNLRQLPSGRLVTPEAPPPLIPAQLELTDGRLLANNFDTDGRFPAAWARSEGMAGFLALELRGPDKRLGVVTLFSRQAISEKTAETLEPLMALLAQAAQNHLPMPDERQGRGAPDAKPADPEIPHHFQALVEQSPDIVITTNLAGLITYANASCKTILGYTPEEVIGTSFNQYVVSEPRPHSDNRLSRIMRVTQGKATELAFRHKDGRVCYIAWTCYALHDPSGAIIGGQAIGRDTTERRQVENELVESEARFRRLLDASLEGIMLVSAAEGRVLDANSSLLNLLGLTAEEFIGRPLAEIPAFQLVFNGAGAVRKLGQQPATHCEEMPLKTRAGEIVYVEFHSQVTRQDSEADGAPDGQIITCNLRNISELKRQIENSQRQAEQLRLLNEISRIINERLDLKSALNVILDQIDLQLPESFSCVAEWRTESGSLNCLATNSAMQGLARAAGFELENPVALKETVLSQCLAAQTPVYLPDLAGSAAPLDRLFATHSLGAALAVPLVVEGASIGMLIICRSGSDSIRQHEINFIEQVANNVGAALRNAQHRRDLKAAYDELKTTQQQVIVQERLRALGTMASGIAHDLNNALTPIVGFADILIDQPEILANREKVLHYLDMIRTSAMDGAGVVSQLREFYRQRDAAEIAGAVDLNAVIRKTLELTAPRWKDIAMAQGIDFRIHTEFGVLPALSAHESELRQMLTNLVINAVDAMPEGGILSFATRVNPDGSVRLAVGDSGCGMTPDVKVRCLEPFFTTKGEQGTGMGLAMVHGIMTRHGGSLEIESAPGRGTTFILTFPAGAAPQPAPITSPAAAPERPLHILYAEDEARVREVVGAFLEGDGHRVMVAANGEEALQMYKPGVFDLVITDKAMPKLNGEQLARQLLTLGGPPPVILLSGFGDMMRAAEERPAGVDLILGKPVALADLRAAIARVLRPEPQAAMPAGALLTSPGSSLEKQGGI